MSFARQEGWTNNTIKRTDSIILKATSSIASYNISGLLFILYKKASAQGLLSYQIEPINRMKNVLEGNLNNLTWRVLKLISKQNITCKALKTSRPGWLRQSNYFNQDMDYSWHSYLCLAWPVSKSMRSCEVKGVSGKCSIQTISYPVLRST